MAGEVARAYTVLRREWMAAYGHLIRLRPPGSRGIPDFCLFHKDIGAVFVEVKSVDTEIERLKFEPLQLETLQDIDLHGGLSCVLAFNTINGHWGGIIRPNRLMAKFRWKDCHEFSTCVTVQFLKSLLVK